MAVWSRTKNDLQRSIEGTVRAMRGNVALISAEDRFAIFGAINEALIDFSLERSIDVPKTIMSDTTIATVAGQAYVDLDSAVVNVIDGTVRIVAEKHILTYFSGGITDFYRFDPGEDIESTYPSYYAIDTDGSGTMRMLLRSTPNAVYTINLKVESMPDEVSTNLTDVLPGWYHGMLRSLATAIALESLGLDGRVHQGRFEERLKNIREKQRGRSGPAHVQLRENRGTSYVAPELRISGSI
jgi:hypothetical protein